MNAFETSEADKGPMLYLPWLKDGFLESTLHPKTNIASPNISGT